MVLSGLVSLRTWLKTWGSATAVLLGWAFFGQQAPGQKPAAEGRPANIQKAIERGVAFLRTCQSEDGLWHHGSVQTHLGATALAGLTLLECDVPANDPQVQKAAEL